MDTNSKKLETNIMKLSKFSKIWTIFLSIAIVTLCVIFLDKKDTTIVMLMWILCLISCKWILYQIKNVALLEFIINLNKEERNIYSVLEKSKIGKEIEYMLGKSYKKILTNVYDIQEKIYHLTLKGKESEEISNQVIIDVSKNLINPIEKINHNLDQLKLNTEDKEVLEDMLITVDELNLTINELFELSKACIEEDTLNIDRIDLNALINQVCIEYEEDMNVMGLSIIKNKPKGKVMIYGDGEKLWKVLGEVFDNICKFAKSNTRIYINLVEDDNHITLEINNISKVELNTTYSQLMKEQKQEHKLGLIKANKLIELHKGSMNVDIDGDLFIVNIKLNKGGVDSVEC